MEGPSRVQSDAPLTFIDLFAGCGGLSLGLLKAGWRGLFGIERELNAFATLSHNLVHDGPGPRYDWPSWLPVRRTSVQVLLKHHKKELIALRGAVTLVAAGLPCQGFSFAGRRKHSDSRNQQFREMLHVVDLVRPEAVLIENVPGIASRFESDQRPAPASGKRRGRPRESYAQRIVRGLLSRGYLVREEDVAASDFGVPQLRRRHVIVAAMGNGASTGLAESLGKVEGTGLRLVREEVVRDRWHLPLDRPVTTEEAIGDLLLSNGVRRETEFPRFQFGLSSGPAGAYQSLLAVGRPVVPDSHRFANHRNETRRNFRRLLSESEPGKKASRELLDSLGTSKHSITVLAAGQPSRTLTTIPDDLVHFSEPRILTVRECARLQSFPDCFEFKGKYTTGGSRRRKESPRYSQVGNAVPPLLAEATGIALARLARGIHVVSTIRAATGSPEPPSSKVDLQINAG